MIEVIFHSKKTYCPPKQTCLVCIRNLTVAFGIAHFRASNGLIHLIETGYSLDNQGRVVAPVRASKTLCGLSDTSMKVSIAASLESSFTPTCFPPVRKLIAILRLPKGVYFLTELVKTHRLQLETLITLTQV